jgi:hypothetical protein
MENLHYCKYCGQHKDAKYGFYWEKDTRFGKLKMRRFHLCIECHKKQVTERKLKNRKIDTHGKD